MPEPTAATYTLEFSETIDLSSYGGKLFTCEPFQATASLTIPVNAETAAGKAAIAVLEKAWRAKMVAWRKEKEKEYIAVLRHTEKAVATSAKAKAKTFLKDAKGDKEVAAKRMSAWIVEQGQIAAGLLKNAVQVFKALAEKTAEEMWVKIAAKLSGKLGSKITKTQVKAVFKIIGMSILVVAGAALAIAGAVLGALAAPTGVGLLAGIGLAVGGIATTAGAIKQILDIADDTWPDHKSSAKKLKDALKSLEEALEYQEAKAKRVENKRSLGPKEKVKLALTNIDGKKKEVREAAKKLELFTDKMTLEIAKAEKLRVELQSAVDKMEDELKSISDDEKAKKKLTAAIEGAQKKLGKYKEAQETAELYLDRYKKLTTRTEELLVKVNTSQSEIGKIIEEVNHLTHSKPFEVLVTVGKGTAEFFKGLFRFLGASN